MQCLRFLVSKLSRTPRRVYLPVLVLVAAAAPDRRLRILNIATPARNLVRGAPEDGDSRHRVGSRDLEDT